LLSKGTGGRVETRNKKPWAVTQGYKSSDSGEEPLDGKSDISILAEPPNLYKQDGALMKNQGHVQIPRFIWNDPRWKNLSPIKRAIFTEICFLSNWEPHNFDVFGKNILLTAGQYGTTLDSLIEKMGGKKFFPRMTVWRALKLFSDYGWLRVQTVYKNLHLSDAFSLTSNDRVSSGGSFLVRNAKQRKTIITILALNEYERSKTNDDTENVIVTDTETVQKRYTNEERKERKEIKERTSLRAKRGSSFLSKNEKKEEKFSFNEEDVELIETYFVEKCVKIKTGALRRWMSKYDKEIVLCTFGLMLESKEPIGNHEGWMGKALQEDWAHLQGNNPINKKWFDDLVHPKKTEIWERKDAFVQNRINEDTFAFALPPETFQPAILNALNFEE
jgi:hypothetical protein